MRKCAQIICIALLLTALCLASAPVASAAADGFVLVELNEVYSFEQSRFYQRFPDGSSFRTNIPNGQATPGFASIELPPELEWALNRNGVYIEYASGEQVFQAGEYILTVFTPGGLRGEFAFTITEINLRDRSPEQARTVILSHVYANGSFYYTFQGGRSFAANVPNGAVANYPVQLRIDADLIAVLTRDGQTIPFQSGDTVAQDGQYHLMIVSMAALTPPDFSWLEGETLDPDTQVDWDEFAREAQEMFGNGGALDIFNLGEIEQMVFSFRILTRPTRDLTVFNLPSGFAFESILLDGVPVLPTGVHSHRFTRDGEYTVTLADTLGRAPNQIVRLTLDRTPPDIILGGVTSGFSTSGAVTLSTEPNATLSVFRNNMQVSPTGRYTQTGRYTVIARDEAGNVSISTFEIRFALPRSLILAGVLTLLALGVAGIVYARRSMKL